jgi:hypothetical protein
MMKEKDYYRYIADWFASEKGCDSTGTEHSFDGLEVLTGDVVGKHGDRFTYACELKPYPYPIGSSGYGSVGQALALRKCAAHIYVGCVASESRDVPDRSWELVSGKRSVAALLQNLNIAAPQSFEEYIGAVRVVFTHFFGVTGLGLLLVREGTDGACNVFQAVSPPGVCRIPPMIGSRRISLRTMKVEVR